MTRPSAQSQDRIAINTTTSNAAVYPVNNYLGYVGGSQPPKRVENAVYAYLQARRSLGDTNVNTSDVAKALRLPQHIVDAAVGNLTSRGVKVR